MMITSKHYSILVTALLTCSLAFGQGTEPTSQYEIQGIYSPTLIDAEKVDVRPEPIATILPTLPVRYEVLNVKGEVPARVDSIAAAKLSVLGSNERLYKGFVKGGFGLYTTPLGEVFYDQTRSKTNGYGIHMKHFSSNGGLDDVGPSKYSFNNIDGFYKHNLPKHEVSVRLMYDRRRVSYYGYERTDSIAEVINISPPPANDQVKQVYNDIGFGGRVRSLYGDSSKIAHDVGLEVHAYSNLTGSSETNVKINTDLSTVYGKETYGVGLLIDNNAYKAHRYIDSTMQFTDVRQSGTLVGLMPNVSTKGDKYVVKVGVGMYVDALGKTTFHFYPQAYLSYNLFDDILIPYVGVDGAKQRNSFRSVTRINPWLNGAPVLANSSKMYDIYGGIRGSLSNSIGFDARVSASKVKDRMLFVSNPYTPYGDQLSILYDDVSVLNISGELHYHAREALGVTARVDISSYTQEVEAEAWNLPPYQLAIGANYDVRDKLILKVEMQFMGLRKAKEEIRTTVVPESSVFDMKGYMDLYLGVEYRYTKRLSMFLDLSNLSASKYERWHRYTVQRSMVLLGATYAF